MGPYFYVLNYFGMLRVDPLEEKVGLDISRHKGPAYDMEGSAEKEHVEELITRRSTRQLDTSQSTSGKLSRMLGSKREAAVAAKDQQEATTRGEGAD